MLRLSRVADLSINFTVSRLIYTNLSENCNIFVPLLSHARLITNINKINNNDSIVLQVLFIIRDVVRNIPVLFFVAVALALGIVVDGTAVASVETLEA